jgi:hypothetical protein
MAKVTPGPGQNSANATLEEPNGDALRTLAKHGLIRKRANNEVDLPFIISMLTKIAAKLGPIQGTSAADESLRAVIILMHDLDEIPTEVQARLDLLEANDENGKKQEERLQKAIVIMEKALHPGNADGARIEERLTEISEGLRSMEESIKGMTAHIPATTGVGEGATYDNTAGPHQEAATFAQIVAQTPAKHVDAVARVAMINRQVVIEGPGEGGGMSLTELSEKEILTKAQLAVEMLANEGMKEAEGIQFIHVRKTARGGAILATRTEEAASWLKQEDVIGQFAEKMGGTLHVRADLCMLIAEYVPVTFDPILYKAFGQVERESGLKKGALREARYIKQIERRKEGQRTAHMFMGFVDTEQANLAIRNGLVIEGKHISMRRHRIDPQRCLKCQKIGVAHKAAECRSIHDTCGRCAGMHRTAMCTITNTDDFKCVNCGVDGHASVDRNCPTFCNKMKATHARFPDYQYRFFPTKDPQTWETERYNSWGEEGQKRHDNQVPHERQGTEARQEGAPYRARAAQGQREDEWEDTQRTRPGPGRGRGFSHSGGGMLQSTLDSTIGGARGRGNSTGGREKTGRKWGDAPMTEDVGPMRSQGSGSSLYA